MSLIFTRSSLVSIERLLCQHVRSWLRTETETQEVVEEEIVQLVWSYQVFRLLLDIAVFIGRNQLRTDRCVDDVAQGDAALLIYPTLAT